MKAKKLLKIMNYLPKWAWYLISFFTAGPFGMLAVYLIFHVLGKIVKEQAEADSVRTGEDYRDEDCAVTS